MSTYASLHYHITFSTKHRAPLIDQTWEKRLHEYLGGTVKHHLLNHIVMNSWKCWNEPVSNMTRNTLIEKRCDPFRVEGWEGVESRRFSLRSTSG